MKKILPVLVLASVLITLSSFAIAQKIPEMCTMATNDTGLKQSDGTTNLCPDKGLTCTYSGFTATSTAMGTHCGVCCLFNTIYTVTNWAFVLLISLAVIFVLLGGFSLMTAAGEPEKISKGRNYIMFAAIGLMAGLAAKIVPTLVKFVTGLG